MRRGTWLLAIYGMMALVSGASLAADPAFGTAGRSSIEEAEGEFPLRSGRAAVTPPTAVPKHPSPKRRAILCAR